MAYEDSDELVFTTNGQTITISALLLFIMLKVWTVCSADESGIVAIKNVKLIRQHFGLGLKESKDIWDFVKQHFHIGFISGKLQSP